MADVIFIRGVSGSGKSTVAKAIQKKLEIDYDLSSHLLEADMYFIDYADKYNFVAKEIGNAHKWCKEAMVAYGKLKDVVIVANTFTRAWELQEYIYELEKEDNFVVVRCNGDYDNIHNVPTTAVQNMLNRFEDLNGIEFCLPAKVTDKEIDLLLKGIEVTLGWKFKL